jgi:hypothetical protein
MRRFRYKVSTRPGLQVTFGISQSQIAQTSFARYTMRLCARLQNHSKSFTNQLQNHFISISLHSPLVPNYIDIAWLNGYAFRIFLLLPELELRTVFLQGTSSLYRPTERKGCSPHPFARNNTSSAYTKGRIYQAHKLISCFSAPPILKIILG